MCVSDTVCVLRLNQVWHGEYRCAYALLWSAFLLVCNCPFFSWVSTPPPPPHWVGDLHLPQKSMLPKKDFPLVTMQLS